MNFFLRSAIAYIYISSFLIIFTQTTFSQAPEIQWTKLFREYTLNVGYAIQQTSDGGYIIAGATSTVEGEDDDVFLIKTDENGDTLWTKTFGGVSSDVGYAIQQTKDDGYIIAGKTESFGAGQSDIWLIKIDTHGDTLWSKTFGGISKDYGYFVEQTTDGGYTIAGETSSFGAGGDDVWLIRTDSGGDTLWTTTFGDSSSNRYRSVQHTSDDGYVIAWQGSENIWLIKIEDSGDTLWTKSFLTKDFGDSISIYNLRSIQQTSDHGYILIGNNTFWHVGNVMIIKTDATGETLWIKTLPKSNSSHSIQQTSDGGYIILTSERCVLPTCGHLYDRLIKTNALGDTTWTIETPNYWRAVTQTSDGGYIVTGKRYIDFGWDLVLVKIAPDITSIDENKHVSEINIQLHQNYPNPFNPSTTIEFTLPKSEFVELKIYNILGEVISTLVSKKLSQGHYIYTFDGKKLASGVYYYTITVGNFMQTRKMIYAK